MNTWIVGKNSMKPYFQIKKLFTVSYIYKILLMKIICMLKRNLKNQIKNLGEFHDLHVQRDALLFADVLKTLKINVLKYMNFLLLIFYLHLD